MQSINKQKGKFHIFHGVESLWFFRTDTMNCEILAVCCVRKELAIHTIIALLATIPWIDDIDLAIELLCYLAKHSCRISTMSTNLKDIALYLLKDLRK